MKSKFKFLFASLILVFSIFNFTGFEFLSGSANRATFVVPPTYSGTPGNAGFLGPLSNAQRTYQLLIHESLLTELAGKDLNGIHWRLLSSAASNWPATDLTYTDFDIYLSESVTPANRSFTFAENVVGVQKKVRSGPLTILTGTYPSGSTPNNFGPVIEFDSTWTYVDGHLLVELRHSTSTGASTSVDALGTSTSGYGTLFSACWVGSYTATTGGLQGNFSIIQLSADDPVSVSNESEIAGEFSLSQNYPNPFNPSTTIKFSLQKASIVTLKLYNAAGSELKTLIDGESLSSGVKSYNFNAGNLSSGVYFYSLIVDGIKIDTKKMMLVK
jgi:hypothetical protein